jgi:hypothetical protein
VLVLKKRMWRSCVPPPVVVVMVMVMVIVMVTVMVMVIAMVTVVAMVTLIGAKPVASTCRWKGHHANALTAAVCSCCCKVVTLLSHSCHIVAALVLHCCFNTITLLLHNSYTVATCFYTVVTSNTWRALAVTLASHTQHRLSFPPLASLTHEG